MNARTDMKALSRAAGHAQRAQRAALVAEHLATEGPEESARCAEHAGMAAAEAAAVVGVLAGEGVVLPGVRDPDPIPLHLLDTPDARALLGGLKDLLPVAERLDHARGRALDSGEGMDLADTLGAVVARLQMEVDGPVGGGRE